jgi:hypothetical protein
MRHPRREEWKYDDEWYDDPLHATPLPEEAAEDLRHGFGVRHVLGVPQGVLEIWGRIDITKPAESKRKHVRTLCVNGCGPIAVSSKTLCVVCQNT